MRKLQIRSKAAVKEENTREVSLVAVRMPGRVISENTGRPELTDVLRPAKQ